MIVQYFILGECLQFYLNCVWCFMYIATIGLFAQLICNSIVDKINTALCKGSTSDGKQKYVIREANLEEVYTSLC